MTEHSQMRPAIYLLALLVFLGSGIACRDGAGVRPVDLATAADSAIPRATRDQ